MKQQLTSLIHSAVNTLTTQGVLPRSAPQTIQVSPCKDKAHGDYATNCALSLAKFAKISPRELALKIVDALPPTELVRKTEIADPGFINFFLDEQSTLQVIPTILDQGAQYGRNTVEIKKKIHIEYVSANPTGPLHVGHGRSAAYGASVANLLSAVGHHVHREYYVNDYGRQMQILALSVWIRYLQLHDEAITLPPKAYQGTYVTDMAKTLTDKYASRFHHTTESIQALHPNEELDPEKHLDCMINIAKEILQHDFTLIFSAALELMLADIHNDLSEFNVTYEAWFRESQLETQGLLKKSIALLEQQGFTYKKDGAVWFAATKFGDDKDRVLVRSNGLTTYFASDVAYHLYKYKEGYDEIIDVFGADHHGYIPRIHAFLKGLNEDLNKITTLVVQFAILYRGKEKVSMSTRAGEFVTLRELRHEVGNDAARFFYILRKPEQHLDFDLDLAKSQTNDNPVYYIQYAHARICSIWRQMNSLQLDWDQALGTKYLSLLTTEREKSIIQALLRYPDVLSTAAKHHEPHSLAYYLLELATLFHGYYNAEKFLVEQIGLRNARLNLIAATKQVFENGLSLLGISAPEKM